jgi:hypothetical protein
MGTALGLSLVTLAEVSKSKNKIIGNVAEVLVQENPMLNDKKTTIQVARIKSIHLFIKKYIVI